MGPGELFRKLDEMLGVTFRWTSIPSRVWGVVVLLVASCHMAAGLSSSWVGGPIDPSTDFTFTLSVSEMVLTFGLFCRRWR